MSKELSLYNRGIFTHSVQISLVIALRKNQLPTVLWSQLTLIHAWWHVTHYVDLFGIQ